VNQKSGDISTVTRGEIKSDVRLSVLVRFVMHRLVCGLPEQNQGRLLYRVHLPYYDQHMWDRATECELK
jgi:hypothetical protein